MRTALHHDVDKGRPEYPRADQGKVRVRGAVLDPGENHDPQEQ